MILKESFVLRPVHALISVELEAECSILFQATEHHQLGGESGMVDCEVGRSAPIHRIRCLLKTVPPDILGVHSHTEVKICLV